MNGKFSLALDAKRLTKREPVDHETNITQGEGGALNASYRIVDAACVAVCLLTQQGLRYGEKHDFYFKTGALDQITFTFRDTQVQARAASLLRGAILR